MVELLDNETTIIYPIELRMFFLESFEVAESLISSSDTDDIVDI